MTATPAEQQLFSHVVALTERHRRSVRLLIVPAHDVFDAIASTVVRLRSSEVYVGESASLSADDQGRLLGEAWEHLEKTEDLQVRLVIYHHSGRTAAYHIGAHPPSLTATDLDLIHRLWRDASKAIGPHVHHHDIVRAALIQMQEQLSGPQRDDALAAIRQVDATGGRTGRRRAQSRLLAAARHGAQSRRRRRRHRADRARCRGSGGRLPGPAAQGRRRRVRVPLARCAGNAAPRDGAGRRRLALQQHGPGRPDQLPRRAAGRRHATAALAAHAGGAIGRSVAARLPRRIRSGD